jgi:hypothetical protein
MRIERFEDIEAWQLARELTRKEYGLTRKTSFAFRLSPQHSVLHCCLLVLSLSKGCLLSAARWVRVNPER